MGLVDVFSFADRFLAVNASAEWHPFLSSGERWDRRSIRETSTHDAAHRHSSALDSLRLLAVTRSNRVHLDLHCPHRGLSSADLLLETALVSQVFLCSSRSRRRSIRLAQRSLPAVVRGDGSLHRREQPAAPNLCGL